MLFFFNDTATTEIYTLSLHDALPIWIQGGGYSWELRVQNDGRFAVVFYEAISPDVFTETTTPLTYNDGEWHHVTGILRSGLAELYVDGVLVARDTTDRKSVV